MPFGLIGAPYSLSACMDYVLAECKNFAKGYCDDIIIYSQDMQTHLTDVHNVLQRLAACGLQINHKKCVFAKQPVSFVGHTLSEDGVSLAAKKVNDFVNFLLPTDVNSLRSFLGMASYCSFWKTFQW